MFDTPKFQVMEYKGPNFPIWACVGMAETFEAAQFLYRQLKTPDNWLVIQHFK